MYLPASEARGWGDDIILFEYLTSLLLHPIIVRSNKINMVFEILSIKKRFVKFTNLFLKFYWLTSVFVKIPGSSAGAFEFEFNSVAA